jgi:hypothetical protein
MTNSIYVQIANFFFVMAAVFNDILLVRYCLVLANGLLVVAAALGWPLWPDYSATSEVAVDSLIWASVAFVLHLWALVHLLLDQRSGAKFDDENSESLYQFFRRRSGIGRRDFQFILTKGKWTRIKELGVRLDTSHELYLVVEGTVDCQIEDWHRRVDETEQAASPGLGRERRGVFKVRLMSGEMFDLRLANVFDVPVGFLNSSFEARTGSKETLVFSWSVDALLEMKRSATPLVLQGWRNLIAFCVADVAHRPYISELERSNLIHNLRHVDFAIPDKEPRRQTGSLQDYLVWMIRSMDPRPMPGLRRSAVPELSVETTASVYGSMSLAKV